MAKPTESDPEPAAAAAPEPLQLTAVVRDSPDEIVCKPPAGVPAHLLGAVVIGNFRCHVDGKAVSVAHGTPVRGLPPAVIKKLRETPEQRVGPFDSRPKKNEQPAAV